MTKSADRERHADHQDRRAPATAAASRAARGSGRGDADQHAQPARQRQRGHRLVAERDQPRRRSRRSPACSARLIVGAARPRRVVGRRRSSTRRPSEIADRAARALRHPGHDARRRAILVATSTGQSERPFSATGHAATASTCPPASSSPDEARCPWRASRTIVARVERRRQPRRHQRRALVGVQRRSRRPPRRNGSHHGSVSSRSRSVS